MRFRKRRGEILEGDMTPMIDMTFQLIAFFMVLINFSQTEQDQRILLPDSVLAKPPDQPLQYPITIHLTREGRVRYGGQELANMNRLRPYLVNERSILDGRERPLSDATVIIRADRLAKAGVVQKLIQVCQEEQFVKFALRQRRCWPMMGRLPLRDHLRGCFRQWLWEMVRCRWACHRHALGDAS